MKKREIAGFVFVFLIYVLLFWGMPVSMDDPEFPYLGAVGTLHLVAFALFGIVKLMSWCFDSTEGEKTGGEIVNCKQEPFKVTGHLIEIERDFKARTSLVKFRVKGIMSNKSVSLVDEYEIKEKSK